MFNPLATTERIEQRYFNFFLASFSPNNLSLASELESLRNRNYLWRDPYISISQPYQYGLSINQFVDAYNLSPAIKEGFGYMKQLYKHQEESILNILNGHNTVISSGTGSGKTESFLIPIVDDLIKNPGREGVKAIVIYPMNALVNDQTDRLRRVLFRINPHVSSKISFASYTGNTPDGPYALSNVSEPCPEDGCGNNLFPVKDGSNSFLQCRRNPDIVITSQKLTRQEIRANPPDILITNYVELEYLLLRAVDSPLFDSNQLRYLILDELHSYTGAQGIDVAYLVRRLKRRVISSNNRELLFVGTSATLSSQEHEGKRKREIADFAESLFGGTLRDTDVFEGKYQAWHFPKAVQLQKIEKPNVFELEDLPKRSDDEVNHLLASIGSESSNVSPAERSLIIGKALMRNPFFQALLFLLQRPRSREELVDLLFLHSGLDSLLNPFRNKKKELEEMIWSYLRLGATASHPEQSDEAHSVPLIRVNIHNFFKTIDNLYVCLKCRMIHTSPMDICTSCKGAVDRMGVCRFCGQDYVISNISVDDFHRLIGEEGDKEVLETIGEEGPSNRIKKLPYNMETSTVELWQTFHFPVRGKGESTSSSAMRKAKKCLDCGSLNIESDTKCTFCNEKNLSEIVICFRASPSRFTQPSRCPFCHNSYGPFSALSRVFMSPNTAGTTLFDSVFTELPDPRKMLIFTDNKQRAAYLAGYLEVEHNNHTMRRFVYSTLQGELGGTASFAELRESVIGRIRDWYGGNFEEHHLDEESFLTLFNKEISSVVGAQRSLESLGLVEITYAGLQNQERFKQEWKSFTQKRVEIDQLGLDADTERLRLILISFLDDMRQNGAMKGLERKKWFERDRAVGYSLRPEMVQQRGIEIKSLIGKTSGVSLFVSRSFGFDEKATAKAVEIFFDFLVFRYLLIRATLSSGKNHAEGFIVNSSKIVATFPRRVKRCSICKRVYINSPDHLCLTYRCSGKTEDVSYEDYLANSGSNYYLNSYAHDAPIRMVTAEDTGAVSLEERTRIETEFKGQNSTDRKVDVIVATPTLELGVDIGDLLAIGLFKSPPAPSNYAQRTGRAGRRDRISLSSTFMFQDPIDNYYFSRPAELIKGEIRAPKIDTLNKFMLRRHINALILEDLLVFWDNRSQIPSNMADFVESESKVLIKQTLEDRKVVILNKIKTAFSDITIHIPDRDIVKLLDDFLADLDRAVETWLEEIERHKNIAAQQSKEMRSRSRSQQIWLTNQIERTASYVRKLESMAVIQYFMQVLLLPRYAFPGMYVDIEDEFGYEEFGGQNRNLAITSYTPGTEITLKKQIYESIGVDIRFTRPKTTSFYVCNLCNVYASETDFETCKFCKGHGGTTQHLCIAPELIVMKRSRRSINEPRDYVAPLVQVYLSEIGKLQSIETKELDTILVSRLGQVQVVQIVDSLEYEDEPHPRTLELCNKCGRVKKGLQSLPHNELSGRVKCDGHYSAIGLYHSMPTAMISLKLRGSSLYGAKISGNKKRFLVTLKNALINAAQLITTADDGEIEGIIKDDELFLYDNVEGGVGYVHQIFENLDEVFAKAAEIVLNPDDDCQSGCLKCLYSYRRKRDVSMIDKSIIKPVLERVRASFAISSINKKASRLSFKGREIMTIVSPVFDLTGVLELKDIIRSAQEELKITSLYVTDDKIDWPDEGRRSWVDILSSIKLDRTKNVRITVIVREPGSEAHRRALRRLREVGVEVLLYKKELEDKLTGIIQTSLPGIVHSKLVVVDPQNPESRYAVITSANFSPEMWKNHDTYNFGRDEEWVRGTYLAIKSLEKESRVPDAAELLTDEGVQTLPLVGTARQYAERLPLEFAKARSELMVMDPYFTDVDDGLELLMGALSRDASVKIITARTDSNKMKKGLEHYRSKGYDVHVIRYFDKQTRTGKETILHDRYVIIDRRELITLGGGLNSILHDRGNAFIEIVEVPARVQSRVENFLRYWNYRGSSDAEIGNFPKEEY